jgi:hypothetical protein
MTTSSPPPQGTDFLFETALRSLDDQMRWIDALDTKAGVLMAADAVVAGLVLTRNSLLLEASPWVGVAVAVLLLISLLLALFSFSTRRFELAPNVSALLPAPNSGSTAGTMRWTALTDVLGALEVNEPKLGQKADLLFYSAVGLMLAVALFGGLFIFRLVT